MAAPDPRIRSLKEVLQAHTRRGELWRAESGGVRCFACGHRCFIPEGRDGICKVRSNRGGELIVPWGYVGGLQVDPIEKKPFFHVLPGEKALSFGMLGCDFHCAYCQNWFTSQALRDVNSQALPETVTPQDLCTLARRSGAKVLTSTYNEPLITSEWAVEIFKKGKAEGFSTAYVSNGNGTREVLQYIRPYVDFYKIDLKGFSDKAYRQLGGVLQNVLDTIRNVYEMGFFLEVVTLLIPGFNDSEEELKQLTEFLVSVSPEIPWHATAFHKDYKMTAPDNTTLEGLLRAAELGKTAGLKYIYLGNAPGKVGEWENTRCPQCQETLISRRGFHIIHNRLEEGHCPKCHEKIPGVWK
jgi:pyruvate formate lyase activating enzyme